MYYFKQFLLIIALLISCKTFSQGECQEDIDKANKLFDEGSFREAEKIAKRTIETCDLNKVQENEMLKLLASIYYEMDELEQGDEYVAQFLKKNPYYSASKRNDPVQFRDALRKLKSYPRFSLGIRAGMPLSQVVAQKVFPILDSADYLQDYKGKPVFMGGLEIAWNINSYISFNTGAGIRMQKIEHQVPQYNQLYFNYEEQHFNLSFPLSIGICIPFGSNFSGQLYAGGEMELFLSSKYSYYYTSGSNISENYSMFLNQKRSNVRIEPDQRNKYRYAALWGMRFYYKLDRFSIFSDVKYCKEFVLYNNPDKRFIDQDLFFANNYALADIMIENLDISLGVLYNFSYKVKSKY